MTKLRPNLQQVLWEIPAIVLAIFLALAVDNCNENRKEIALADKALEAILLEVQENQASLDSNLITNEKRREVMLPMRDSLKAGVEVGVSIGYDQIIMSNGAWEMAKLSGAIRRFEPRTIQNLSGLYHLQEMYMKLGNGFFEELASTDFHKEQGELPRVEATLNLIKITDSIGKALMDGYGSFLTEYEAKVDQLEKAEEAE